MKKMKQVLLAPITSPIHFIAAIFFIYITANTICWIAKDSMNPSDIHGGVFGVILGYTLLYLPFFAVYYYIAEKFVDRKRLEIK